MVKKPKLTPTMLEALPISAGEARKLLGAASQNLSDEDVAREILLLSELARLLIQALDLQK